jgi:hypothetical protein
MLFLKGPALNHWIAETDRQADEFFATLTTEEIRRRQELARQQIRRAYEARNEGALADLTRMEAALIRAMLSRSEEN